MGCKKPYQDGDINKTWPFKVRFIADVCERKKGYFTICTRVYGDYIYSKMRL